MMQEVVVRGYVDAFLAHTSETIGFDNGIKELQNVRRVFRDNPNLFDFLTRLDIGVLEKNESIDIVFAEGFSTEICHFMKLLLRNGRMGLFMDIAEYARITYAHGTEHDALLMTSSMLDVDVLQELKRKFEEKLNIKLHLYVDIDPSLLGGVYLKVGHMVIDGSVRRRLEDLREKLNAVRVV